MKYTLTIRREDYATLRDIVLSAAPLEGAAYLLCGESRSEGEVRLLVREVVPVQDDDYLVRERYRLSIRSQSYARIAKHAAASGGSVLFIHSHPGGDGVPSPQDDREDPGLMDFFESRVADRVHGSGVIGATPEWTARVFVDGEWQRIDTIRIIGQRFAFLRHPDADVLEIPQFFDRQVRAFGPDLQRLLKTLHVGIVGAGGIGSIVADQLARLGVGEVSLFDHDALSATNVTRVYGSTTALENEPKAKILADHLKAIGLGTDVHPHPFSILAETTAKELRACDVVFGCTDKEAPRAILNSLALYYLIPVFDLGVKISSTDGVIESIDGRITILTPGAACLYCRGRITAETIRLESLTDDERTSLAKEGYAPELPDHDPAVITFTTAVATKALTEFLNRLTGAISDEYFSEYLQLFHLEKVVRTNRPASPDCVCGQPELWGRGDRKTFLDQLWPPVTPTE